MRCVDCRWFNRENDICLKDGEAVFGIYVDTECEYVTNMTVFDQITASPEVLAERFIYTVCTSDGEQRWCSALLEVGSWFSESEAIAATVEKLKEQAE